MGVLFPCVIENGPHRKFTRGHFPWGSIFYMTDGILTAPLKKVDNSYILLHNIMQFVNCAFNVNHKFYEIAFYFSAKYMFVKSTKHVIK